MVNDSAGAVLRANLAARQLARQFGRHPIISVLPEQHRVLVARCLDTGNARRGVSLVGERRLTWTYRRIRRRNLVCAYGTVMTGAGSRSSFEASLLKTILDNLAIGVLVVDADLSIEYANPQAIELLEASWPSATEDSRLFKTMAWTQHELRSTIAKGEGVCLLHRNHGQAPLEVATMPISASALGSHRAARPLSIIFLVDPEFVAPAFPERLKSLFGLTPAEVRVATCLKTGARLKEAAQLAGIGRATINTHLKALRKKTNTTQTSALLWRLNCSIATVLLAGNWLSDLPFLTQ